MGGHGFNFSLPALHTLPLVHHVIKLPHLVHELVDADDVAARARGEAVGGVGVVPLVPPSGLFRLPGRVEAGETPAFLR